MRSQCACRVIRFDFEELRVRSMWFASNVPAERDAFSRHGHLAQKEIKNDAEKKIFTYAVKLHGRAA